jgi:hypothetical protein
VRISDWSSDVCSSDLALVYGDARVYGNARVFGNACVYGDAQLRGFDELSGKGQHFVIQGFEHAVTVTYSSIHVGCLDFTLDQLDDIVEHPEMDSNSIAILKPMVELALEHILTNLGK